jgi:hypothetical protein
MQSLHGRLAYLQNVVHIHRSALFPQNLQKHIYTVIGSLEGCMAVNLQHNDEFFGELGWLYDVLHELTSLSLELWRRPVTLLRA